MNPWHIGATALLSAAAAGACAQAIEHPLGDHPAVVVQRLHAQQGYDYAAKFYPHPAALPLDSSASPASPATATGAQHDAKAKPATVAFKTRPAPAARRAETASAR